MKLFQRTRKSSGTSKAERDARPELFCYDRSAQFRTQARMLTPQEKASLARILIEELDSASDADVEQLWIEESQRRYEAYLRGELKFVSGDEVMGRVRSRLK